MKKYYQESLETGSLFLKQADISNTLVTKVPENLLKS